MAYFREETKISFPHAAIKLKEVYAKGGRSGKMVFAVWETRFTNQEGKTVARVRESFVRKKGRKP